MRFVASDSKVVHRVHGVVFEIVGLPIRLAFPPGNCVVFVTMLLISALCRLDLLRMLLHNSGDHLLLLVTSKPCTKTSTSPTSSSQLGSMVGSSVVSSDVDISSLGHMVTQCILSYQLFSLDAWLEDLEVIRLFSTS